MKARGFDLLFGKQAGNAKAAFDMRRQKTSKLDMLLSKRSLRSMRCDTPPRHLCDIAHKRHVNIIAMAEKT